MISINEKIAQLNEVDRFILLLLGAKSAEPVPGPIHFQKEMFLLSNLFPNLGDNTDYEPYLLGPYSDIVANEAEQLKMSGLVNAEPARISLTKDGKQAYDLLLKASPEGEIKKIEEFKDFLNDLSKDELLAFIYFSYPSLEELEKESAEYKDLLPKRKKLAISLYKKGKISAQKSAQIAGETLESFLKELKTVA
jgi:uncharacterized protein YwgA